MKRLFKLSLQCCQIFHFRSSSRNRTKMVSLESLNFDNLALRKLPIDPVDRSYVRTVNGACFSKVKPTPVQNPRVVACSPTALELLDLPESEFSRKDFAEYFSGNKLLPGSDPAAHCYCGHQFGYFSGQLGDGAAIYLGEVLNKQGERWEIQLKGAGLTPYSRTADGRKVLRSTIREFLCSEAMHFLGIPTSRAGTCITSDSEVIRDIFYDGHPKAEKCTIVLRIAPTFIRFGSFEIFKTLDSVTGKVGPSVGRVEMLHTLLNYVIETFYPEIYASSNTREEKYADFFKEVVVRTARLVALWQSVGFCHGVLNTDNMSIVGLTIDYGPYGFLDMYDPNHICNASDEGGRYSFVNQPEVCMFNLKKLAEAIQQALPLEVSLPLLELYQPEFQSTFYNKMRSKLGLIAIEDPDDNRLFQELFDTMENTGADFTNTFLSFSSIDVNDLNGTMEVSQEQIIEQCYSLAIMMSNYSPDINAVQIRALLTIARSNPELLDRLGKSGLAIQRILSQLEKLDSLKKMTKDSKLERDKNLWSKWLKKYQKRLETDLEAYEGDVTSYNAERIRVMENSNPRFILRNYILQGAIEKAEKEDYSEVQKLMEMLEKPYDASYLETHNNHGESEKSEAKESTSIDSTLSCNVLDKSPTWGFSIKVS